MNNFSPEKIPPITKERIKEIREAREKVTEELPDEQKKDKGEIRYQLSQLLMEEDKNLPEIKSAASTFSCASCSLLSNSFSISAAVWVVIT